MESNCFIREGLAFAPCVWKTFLGMQDKEKMLAVYFDQPGDPENLYVKEIMKAHPGKGEVLIKVSASALNRADLLQRRGMYPSPEGASDILGLEAAGLVAGFGPGCKGQWKIGDRVMALLSGGGQAEYVTVPEGHLMPIPTDMMFVQAAAIPEAWLTAFQLLHFVGKVQRGQTVLIHAGASGVGTAAIQLARLAKAIPIVTAGTQEKLQLAAKLGAAAGFNYKEEDFSERVLDFTNGSGVDVILDCIGGSYCEKNLNCLSTDGQWIVYGLLGGGEVHGDLLAKLLSKRGSLLTSLLRSREKEYKEQLVKAFTDRVLPHFSQDRSPHVQPIIDSVYPLHRIVEAHRIMEENKNVGKVIIEMPPPP
ncbi:quinone oxidoreductase PIG3 isoform X2 [Emydura macquarii macquarii]|uniref:quinone oxidoreductase PIG3 isoform X2 n=1 Tax=Emydura macquarii macquarii TaxID=1129001 RepID=UPI00352BD11F